MALYSELSAEDQAVVQNTVNLIRAASGQIAQQFNRQKAIADDSNAIALILSIDAIEAIPNTSGLAGSDGMTRAEFVTLWNDIELARTTVDDAAFRALASQAAGINALLG